MNRHPMTSATGLGPLPDLLEASEGPRTVRRLFRGEGLSVEFIDQRDRTLPLQSPATLLRPHS